MPILRRARILTLPAALLLLSLCGCRSYWVETTVNNQTGETLHEIEVDYPSASFGINSLAPGATMHYHFKIQGSGPVKVQYALGNGKTLTAQGLNLTERQQGQLTLRLLPKGKVDFLPDLRPAP
jgi:hypothetical protein